MGVQEAKPAWNKDSKFALNFNKFICWPLGVWPLDYNSAFSNFRLVCSLVSQLWLIYAEAAAACSIYANAADIVDYVMISICCIMSISKIITFRVHMDTIRGVFFCAMNDWLSVENDEDRATMKSFAKLGRSVFLWQMGFSYIRNTLGVISILPFLMPPIIVNGSDSADAIIMRELPAKTGCLFGHYGNVFFVFYYAYESIVMNIAVTHGNIGCDLVIFSILMHLCGQIELIKKDLRAIAVTSENSKGLQEKIRNLVQKHAKILELARSIEIAASGMLMIQLFCNSALNLMLGIRFIMALRNRIIGDAVKSLVAFIILMLQLYLISYASDFLSRQSKSVVDALYESEWFELPPKLRKTLCFVAMRANKPASLVAVHFYTLNVENFKNILKASLSYFSVLRLMFDG